MKKQTLVELAAQICWCGDSAERFGMITAAHTLIKSEHGPYFAWMYRDAVRQIDDYLYGAKLDPSEGELQTIIHREGFLNWIGD